MALGEPWSVEGQEPMTHGGAEPSASRLVSPTSDLSSKVQAPHGLEAMLARLNQRLDRTEAATTDALHRLQATMDRRSDEQRFDALARDLRHQVEAVRTDLLQGLKSATDSRFAALAKAIEAMGQHLQSTEQRNSVALDQVSGEVARLSGAMDQRLGRYEIVQSDAIERLGSEMDRITDRLSEKIASSDRRSAQAVTHVQDQFSQLSRDVEQRAVQATTSLSDRIRQSEERTARLLAEARTRLDLRPAPVNAHETIPAQPEIMALNRNPVNPFMVMEDLPIRDPADLAEDGIQDRDSRDDEGYNFFSTGLAAELAAKINASQDDDLEIANDETDTLDLEADNVLVLSPMARFSPSSEAKAPERAETEPPAAATWQVIEGDQETLFAPSAMRARSKAPQRPAPLRKAMVASLAVMFVGLGLAGLTLLGLRSQNLSTVQADQTVQPKEAPVPRAAVAVLTTAPSSSTDSYGLQTQTPSKPPISEVAYRDLQRQLNARDATALPKLEQLADANFAPAQADLGKLFENGDLGLSKDFKAARLWTERAARSGVVEAMHRMGLYHYYGQGGAQNLTLASQWFRRAAERGMLDSQYNLAQLYETGVGVTASPSEAYRWYLIASRSGDDEALKKVTSLGAELPANVRAEIERQAKAFKAQS